MVAGVGKTKRVTRYPLTNHDKFSTVYGYMRTVLPILRYLGLCPVKKTHEGGMMKFRPYVSLLYLLQVGCEISLISYLTVHLTINFSKEVDNIYSFNAIELFSCIMFAAHVIGSKIRAIQYRKECIDAFNYVHEVDVLFKSLGIKVSYRNMLKGSRTLSTIGFLCYPICLVITYHNEAHFLALFFQLWRVTSINMFALFLILLYSKYRKLNKFLKLYIKENEEGIPLTNTDKKPLEIINLVADIYDKLSISGKNWNLLHNTALSVNLFMYSVATTLFSIAYYFSPEEMVAMIPAFILLFLEFFYVLTVSQITRNECQKIMLNINEMSCCYIDNDLWRARNSFLLQTLHQRVNFTVLQVFPLDYSMAIKIGGIVLSVLVLTIQIKSLEEAQ